MAGCNNKREEAVKDEAEKLGFEVLGRGWPDFLCYDKKTKQVLFIEVKAAKRVGAKLTKIQRRMHKILKQLGLNVNTIQVGANIHKHRPKIKEKIRGWSNYGQTN